MQVLPAYYDPSTVGAHHQPDVLAATRAGSAAGLAASADDALRIALLLIDMQADFVFADGSLSVPGAIEDTRRTIEWMYRNAGHITTIFASLDSHLPLQIFSPAWWQDEAGRQAEPYTVITAEAVLRNQWQPRYDIEWSKTYVKRLEEDSRKQLMIWPYHTLLGTPGHNLVPELYEAMVYHATARQTQPQLIVKGNIARSENYSIFEPEVSLDELPDGGLNRTLLDQLAGYDRIYVAGQAKSHCVMESVDSFVEYFADQPEQLQKMVLLTDAMSSVAHPEIDFDAIAAEAFQRYVQLGLHLSETQHFETSL